MINITKRTFWSVSLPAWRQAFTTNNIASSFAKTGLWPYNPSIVLDVITKKPSSSLMESSQTPKTPLTCHAVRRIHRMYKLRPQTPPMSKILHANERLAAEHAINQNVIKGLLEVLKYGKKRRRKGKRLNVLTSGCTFAATFILESFLILYYNVTISHCCSQALITKHNSAVQMTIFPVRFWKVKAGQVFIQGGFLPNPT